MQFNVFDVILAIYQNLLKFMSRLSSYYINKHNIHKPVTPLEHGMYTSSFNDLTDTSISRKKSESS